MTGYHGSGVLDATGAFEHRLEEITDLTKEAEPGPEEETIDDRQLGEENDSTEESAENAASQPAKGTLDTLFRTDGGIKTAATDGTADKIGDGIADHDDDQHQKNPLPAEGEETQQRQVSEEQWQIKKTEEDAGQMRRHRREITEAKEEQQSKSEDSCGQPGLEEKRPLPAEEGRQSRPGGYRQEPFAAPVHRQQHGVEFTEGKGRDDDDHPGKGQGPGINQKEDQQGEGNEGGDNTLLNDGPPREWLMAPPTALRSVRTGAVAGGSDQGLAAVRPRRNRARGHR